MLKGRCLKCGLPERTISSCLVCSAKSKASPATPPLAKAGASSTLLLHPAAKSCPSGKAAALLAVQRTVYPKAVPAAAAPDWDARAESWFAKNPQIVFDASGWTAFKPVLVALAVAWKSPKRYLEEDSDSPKCLWKVLGRKPRKGTDFKRHGSRRGGNEPFHIRRAFLKDVVKERYRTKLSGPIVVNHGCHNFLGVGISLPPPICRMRKGRGRV